MNIKESISTTTEPTTTKEIIYDLFKTKTTKSILIKLSSVKSAIKSEIIDLPKVLNLKYR